MRKTLAIMILGMALALVVAPAWAGDVKNVVVPYGDYCTKCSSYGWGGMRPAVMHDEAQAALMEYFHHRGLGVRNIFGMGRFLRADVVRNGIVVDRIIFDRKTGRIRSTY